MSRLYNLFCGCILGLPIAHAKYFGESIVIIHHDIVHNIYFTEFVKEVRYTKYVKKEKKVVTPTTYTRFKITYKIDNQKIWGLPVWDAKEIIKKHRELSYRIFFIEQANKVTDRILGLRRKPHTIKKEVVYDTIFVLDNVLVGEDLVLSPNIALLFSISAIDKEIEIVFKQEDKKTMFRVGYSWSTFTWIDGIREEKKYNSRQELADGLKQILLQF